MKTSAVVACPWCAGLHGDRKCPLVKALEFHESGSIRRVEFFAPIDYAPLIDGATMGKSR